MIINCEPLKGPNTTFWPILKNNTKIGKVTSAVYSPRLKKNIALGMVSKDYSEINTEFSIEMNDTIVNSVVVSKPFYDPSKKITSKVL